jgi:uridine kinase
MAARLVSFEDLIERVRTLGAEGAPKFVGLDGRSGVGKSTLASALAEACGGTLLEGDGFFAGGTTVREDSAAERAEACIDRPKLVAVLEELKAGRAARYRPFDWEAFDGRLASGAVEIPATALYIVEGVYACHPNLRHLLDLRVMVSAEPAVRMARLVAREGAIGPWERQWHEAEDWYFMHLMPRDRFDLLVDTSRSPR